MAARKTQKQLDEKPFKADTHIQNLSDAKFLDAVIHSIIEGVIVANGDSQFVYWNQTAKNIIGIGPQKIKPEEWSNFYGFWLDENSQEEYPADKLPLVKAIAGETFTDIEVYVKNPNKPNGVWISVSGKPLRDKNGNHYEGGVVVFRDITELKQSTKDAKYFKEFYDTAPVGFYTTSVDDGAFLKANKFCIEMLGFENLGQLKNNLKASEIYSPTLRKQLIHRLEEHETVTDFEIPLSLPNNVSKWVILTARLCENKGCIEGSVTDVTHRKELEDEVKELRNLKQFQKTRMMKDLTTSIRNKLLEYRGN